MSFNLTWIFQVDPSSMYLTRLHFCDYFYSKVNEIVFKIFINNQTAEAEADVIGWTGGKGVATYKDYVIYVKDEAGDDQLWLALHPAPETEPEFYDSLLNGVEVSACGCVCVCVCGYVCVCVCGCVCVCVV